MSAIVEITYTFFCQQSLCGPPASVPQVCVAGTTRFVQLREVGVDADPAIDTNS
jgi:hypothetical protein